MRGIAPQPHQGSAPEPRKPLKGLDRNFKAKFAVADFGQRRENIPNEVSLKKFCPTFSKVDGIFKDKALKQTKNRRAVNTSVFTALIIYA